MVGAMEREGDPVNVNLNKAAAEATCIMVCMALRNLWVVRAFNDVGDASSSLFETCAGQWKSSSLLVSL